ncbi:MAG: sarcosine oxidase subunit gamma [Rhodoferax sp.]
MSDSTTASSAAQAAFRNPFASLVPQRKANRDGDVQVHLHAHRLQSVVLISTWMGGTQGLCTALAQAMATTDLFALPETTGHTAPCALGLLMRTGPHEFMLVGDGAPPLDSLCGCITLDVGSVLDLSHARCRVHVQGPKAVEALGKLFALDFRDAAFPPGQVKLTGHHHVPCSIHRIGPANFDVYMLSTYARGQLESLQDAALEYGVELVLG